MTPPRIADLSVLTLAAGRPRHLANLVRGLTNQTVRPRELIVAVMQEAAYALPHTPFPVRQIRLPQCDRLPLAAARNAAAREAEGSALAFLDVDCIPAASLVGDYAAAAKPGAGLFMGEVEYLPEGAADPGWTYAGLDRISQLHPEWREAPIHAKTEACEDYRSFRSLNFALAAKDFHRSAGFDEGYLGYGGEDTDFAKAFTVAGGRLSRLRGAKAYHQYHALAMPPIHHLDSVIENAERFRQKWGYPTMGHWLYAFELMGLIAWDRTKPGKAITVLRRPGPEEERLCAPQSPIPCANAMRVIRHLQETTGQALSDAEATPATRAAQARMLDEACAGAVLAAD